MADKKRALCPPPQITNSATMTSHPSLFPDMNDSLLHPQLNPIVLQQQSLRLGNKSSDLTDQSDCGAKSRRPPPHLRPEKCLDSYKSISKPPFSNEHKNTKNIHFFKKRHKRNVPSHTGYHTPPPI